MTDTAPRTDAAPRTDVAPGTDERLQVTLVDQYTPRATAGIYTVRSRHELWKDGQRVDTAALPESSQTFEIRPVRFTLSPNSVHAYYPPHDCAGRYANVLPHITLNRAVLPWERELAGDRAEAHAGWLALLLFKEGELPDDPKAGGVTVERPVRDLIDSGDAAVIGPDLSGPSLTPEVLASRCQTIDVPAAVFARILPTREEMFYLQHVRDVTTATRRAGGEVLTEGMFAVITGNRFPRDTGFYACHLVSLEGFEPHVGPNPPTGHSTVRLCSLRSWSFQNDPDNVADIAGMLANLAAPSREDHADNLLLRLNPPAPSTPSTSSASSARTSGSSSETYVRERLRLGYVATPFRTLSGETTFAWYRGPFAPVATPDLPDPGLAAGHTTSDHALIYEEEHGLFDVSYATAWTLGRTLGLADPDYAADIIRARRQLHNRAATLRKLAADPARAAADPDRERTLRGLRQLEAFGGRSLAAALAAPLAETPPPRPRRRAAPLGVPQLLADERAAGLLRAAAERATGAMPAWLDRLARFEGVPFCYLVPSAEMLPGESLRLFRVDQAWLRVLVAGAADVGLHTSLDVALDPQIRGAVARARGRELPEAGLLVHSRLLRALPGLEVTAYRKRQPVTELRRDLLGPEILLVLFGQVPDTVEFREPGQGIHFGIDHGGVVMLRSLDPADPGWSLEEAFPTGGETVFERYLRPAPGGDTPDVLRVRDLARGLGGALGPDRTDLTQSEFALQLVNAPLLQQFRYLSKPGSM
ncbi:hypothetical protein [Frankia sp. QA3]|uniref:hypothetical protein n=1 Tax=Frankia sp. QA3 TaxID=710111 RepID=UPI000269BFF2|nr:hypothetical protein [Frankia sp. QA3]EIV92474.1 hypothetical protein FraQA3DRAFT_2042 [Frankia sp. QA3]